MSGPGFVTTARGDSLNIDDLIEKAKRPLNFKQAKSELDPKATKPTPINVRGFVPAAGAVKKFDFPTEAPVEVPAPPSSYSGEPAQTMVDLTGILMDKPRNLKKIGEGRPANAGEVVADRLGAVMQGLQEMAPKSLKAGMAIDQALAKRKKKDDDLGSTEITE